MSAVATAAAHASLLQRFVMLVAGAAAIGLAVLPLWAGAAEMRLVVEFCYYLALAESWNLLAGYAGIISVGQQAFVGLGSYAFLSGTIFAGLHPLLALPLAGLFAACFAVPAAFIMFRLQGAYFAIGTWALAEVLRTLFTQIQFFGAGTGRASACRSRSSAKSRPTERRAI